MKLKSSTVSTTTPQPVMLDQDAFVRVIEVVLRLAFRLLKYLGRRFLQDPLVGLAYLIVAVPSLFLMVQDLRQVLAVASAPRFSMPARIWPLDAPLPLPAIGLLAIAICLVVAFDRWRARRITRIAGHVEGSVAEYDNARDGTGSVDIGEWVLGSSYERAWNPDPGEFKLEAAKVTNQLFKLTEEHLRTHLIVVAPTGSGKTRSVLEPALLMLKRIGASALVFDAKGDDFDPAQFHLNFDLDDPTNSMRLNVWSGRTPREMGERLGEALVPEAGMGNLGKAYFTNNAKDAIASLVAAHHQAYGAMPNLKHLLAYLRKGDARQDLADELHNAGLSDDCEELLDLQRINQLAEQKNDALGSLDTALAPLARGEIANLLTTSEHGYSIEQLLQQPVRVRFALPVGRHPRVAPIIGRLVLAQFTYAVISPDCNKQMLKAAVIDEAHNFITPTIAKGMAMARENRGCFMLALQNLSQIADPALREDILSVAGNKLVMAGVGDFDAEKFSALFGTQEREYIAHSQGTSQGSNHSYSRGHSQSRGGDRGNGNRDMLNPMIAGVISGGGAGTREQSTRARSSSLQQSNGTNSLVRGRADFLPSEIRSLPQFHVLIERRDSRGEVTPATIVNLDRELITDVSDIQALRLYSQVGRLEARPPKLPALPTLRPLHTGKQIERQIITFQVHSREGIVEAVDTVETAVEPRSPESLRVVVQCESSDVTESSSSHSTKSNDQAMDALPDWVEEAAHNITVRIGIARPEAEELAHLAYRNGRDASYVMDNLDHVTTSPNVKSPAALFTFLVRGNQQRYPPSTKKVKPTGT